jgi:hypothetical protein
MADSENTQNELLDAFSFELAVLAAKRYVSLLPARHVPLSWLRELATADCPALADRPRYWVLIVSVLETSGVLLGGDTGTGVRAGGPASRDALGSMDEEVLGAVRRRLRAFCSARLAANRAEEQRLINGVMTGDPDKGVTAWTVPTVEDVLARAAGDERVQVVQFGDGSYSVRRVSSADWEIDCLKAFAVQEFAGRDLAGVAWALRTSLLTSAELKAEEDRVGKGHVRSPDNDEAALVAGLYWLSLAHKQYGEGWSSRGSWHLCGTAVELLERLQERRPDDNAVAVLLAEVKHAQWTYDD